LIFLEAVTFLGNQERDRNLYAIPGLDYVAHEDVIPYTVDINKHKLSVISIE
jgi:polymerase delta-interacting protein 2